MAKHSTCVLQRASHITLLSLSFLSHVMGMTSYSPHREDMRANKLMQKVLGKAWDEGELLLWWW